VKCALILLLIPASAQAETYGASAGVAEVVTAPHPGHAGFYLDAAGWIDLPAAPWFVDPSIGVEAAPDTRRWGFFGALTVGRSLGDRVALEADVTAVHDQSGTDLAEASYFGGIGIAIAYFRARWSFAPSITALRDLGTGDDYLSFALTASLTL
jgi:hypothetical protein